MNMERERLESIKEVDCFLCGGKLERYTLRVRAWYKCENGHKMMLEVG